jgi:filamentous hemagglutinin
VSRHRRRRPPLRFRSPGNPGAAVIRFSSGGKGAWNRVLNRPLLPNARYIDDATGYSYDTDAEGRVTAIRGTLIAKTGDRNAYQQRVAGGTDRLSTDDGGHFIATVFKGPGERINLALMDFNLNRGAWKAMENRWTEALKTGKQVEVTIDVTYAEGSRRPTYYVVKYTISGSMPVRRRFKNSPGGK